MAGSMYNGDKPMDDFVATCVTAETLTPFHYHSVAVQSGTATLPNYIGDRAISFSIGAVLGCLCPSPALPKKNYRAHMKKLPCLASLFETDSPSLMAPLGKRLNIDAELGFHRKIQEATSTGNLKTWFFVQEVPIGKIYKGALFGCDPFKVVSEIEGKDIDHLVVRIGRHLGGIAILRKVNSETVKKVQLNAHTATIFGKKIDDVGIKMVKYAMHDMQVSNYLTVDKASEEVSRWLS